MAEDRIDQELRELGRAWAGKLEGKLAAIEEAARPVLDGSGDRTALESSRFLLHRLGGSGSSFGFPEVSRSALAAEHALKKLLAESRLPTGEEREHLGGLIDAVRRACQAAAAATGGKGTVDEAQDDSLRG